MIRTTRLIWATAAAVLIGLGTASADTTYKMTTPFAPGVAVPDEIESSIGTLNLNYGYPSADTVDKIYDNLDRSRALQAYLLAIPIVNQAGMRESLRQFGPDNQTNVIWESLMDSKTVALTGNDNTIYNFMWVDTSKGPVVAEVPAKVLGTVDDFWYKWVADIGITGADKGEGGKYLLLPPGFKGDIPDGYHVLRPSTFGSYFVFRAFLVDGSTQPAVNSVKKNLRIYPLAEAANPPPMHFVNASGIPSNFVSPGDYAFWSLLNQVIQEEPADGSDPTTLGLFASIGIEKGKPFNPDERMKKILTDAANIGAVTARTIAFKIRPKDAYFYPDSAWRLPFLGGYKFEVGARCQQPGWCRLLLLLCHCRDTGNGGEDGRPRLSIPGRCRMRRAIPSMAARTISCACRQISRSRISGRSSSTTTRPARWCRPINKLRASAARPKASRPIRMVRWMSILDPRPRQEWKTTGCRRFRARAGSRSFASTVRLRRGSTRAGGLARSNWCNRGNSRWRRLNESVSDCRSKSAQFK